MKRVYISVVNDLVTDQRVHKVAQSLHNEGAEVLLLGRQLPLSPEIKNRDYAIKRFKIAINQGPLFYVFFNIRLIIYLIFKKKGILVANDLDTLLANYIISKIRRMPLVYDSHEFFTEVPELINRPFPRKVWLTIEKWMVPRVKYSYTVCEPIAEEYHKRYGISMEIIKNLPPKLNENILETSKSKNQKVLLYQGALNIGRGIEYMIDAMQYLDDFVLRIIGDGDISDQLKDRVKSKELDSKVHFLGRLPFDELIDETVQADLGLALEEPLGLNYYYALPNKLFDYIQAQIPVLVSPFPEMQRIVNKYEIGTVYEHKTPQALAATIEEIFNLKNRFRKWQKNLQKAAEELNWEKNEDKLLNIYRRAGLA